MSRPSIAASLLVLALAACDRPEAAQPTAEPTAPAPLASRGGITGNAAAEQGERISSVCRTLKRERVRLEARTANAGATSADTAGTGAELDALRAMIDDTCN